MISNNKKFLPDGLLPLLTSSFALFALKFNVGNDIKFLLAGTAGISILQFVSQKLYRTKLDKFFEMTHLETERRRPQLVKRKKISNDVIEYEYRLPCGLAMSKVEDHKEELEQYLRSKVEFRFDGNMFITVYESEYKSKYEFELIETKGDLEVCLGYTKRGDQLLLDIEQAPHIMICGATGGGKSTCLRSIITSLIMIKGNNISLALVDFQKVELCCFQKCKQVKSFCSTADELAVLLHQLEKEAKRRLKLFYQNGVNNISRYNSKVKNMNYIVIVIDEFPELTNRPDIIDLLVRRLSQDRKCGFSYILSAQRLTTDIIKKCGSLKNNISVRICFQMNSFIDSKTVLDEGGAEQITEAGVGLLKNKGKMIEFKGMFLDEDDGIEMLKPFYRNDDNEDKPKNKANNKRPPDYEIY